MNSSELGSYIVDKNGNPKAVVIDMKNYKKLQHYIEDLEDALDLKEAKAKTKKVFYSFESVVKELNSKGRL